MSKTAIISKKPALISTVPSDTSYKGLSQSELLAKVKMLHEQVLKTNRYLMEVHRMAIYNWDDTDTGNIMVELPVDKKGFLLDSVVRLRGAWDPATNELGLIATDASKIGWLYKVTTAAPVECLSIAWKNGDYALYDEEGVLYNVQADLLASLFTPIITIESDTIQFEALPQTAENVQIRAHLKVDPTDGNDLTVTARGVFSNAYTRAKGLITVQETAPTSDNLEGGLKIVFLLEAPETFYSGYLYLIPPLPEEIPN